MKTLKPQTDYTAMMNGFQLVMPLNCEINIGKNAPVRLLNAVMERMIAPALGSSFGLIQYKWFSKLQFKPLKIKSDLFDCYFRDTCAISKKDMIAFLQANSLYSLKESIKNCSAKVYIFVGGKENKAMQKSARIIHQALQESVLQVLPKLYHGEFSINHGNDYSNKIREIAA